MGLGLAGDAHGTAASRDAAPPRDAAKLLPHTPFRGCKGPSWEGGVRVPTLAYWKGRIKPRRSEGLFDQADLLPTVVSLAGKPGAQLTEFLPKTTYIDGVDQTSMLLADNGESARRERIYTLNQDFAGSVTSARGLGS